MVALLAEAGYLTSKEGHLHLSPKGIRKIGQLALRDIYQGLFRDRAGSHQADHRGIHEVRPEATAPYQYGDPLNIDLAGTLKKALLRRAHTPLELHPDDFEVFAAYYATSTSTVLLLDMSWSMSWEGRFAAAKKVALAMESLIRSRYPRDYFANRRFLHPGRGVEAQGSPGGQLEHGRSVHQSPGRLRLASATLEPSPE